MEELKNPKTVKEVFKDYNSNSFELSGAKVIGVNLYKRKSLLEVNIQSNKLIGILDILEFEKYVEKRFFLKDAKLKIKYELEDEENIVHEYNDIVRLEDRAEISYFLNFLSSEQREAVILRFGEQLSFGEIAKVMGCNMRTAQSRVRNALKIMRKEQENER